MLVVVLIAYVDSGSAVKEISREEGVFSLIPSSIGMRENVCLLVLTWP
jgi:hypothetical protein